MTTQKIQQQQGQAVLAFFRMLSGGWTARMFQVAAELGIADLLKDGPKTAAELAKATQTHTPSLTRLMRALVALGVFAEQEPDVYSQTDLSCYLCEDYPGTLRSFALFSGLDWIWATWRELSYAVKTGQSAMKHAHGMNAWQYLDAHPQESLIFNKALAEFSALINPSILESYNFSSFQTLVDVGGGHGSFLMLLLERYPSLHGILFDRASVMEEAKALYAQTPFASRCTFVAGNFLTELPSGADVYLFKFIANDWGDEYLRQMLTVCRNVIPAYGKLLVMEFVLVPQRPTITATLMDITTFLSFEGGRGRTELEFRTLFTDAGFTLSRIIPTSSGVYILEGVPNSTV
ncbi:MAG: hypothetical protein JO202_09565 [Ktedonobacteraceae bacterium]|nr:hypothetical protein [Ktedonobacteraceae bacterium]